MKKNYDTGTKFPLEYVKTAPVQHSFDYDSLTDREGFLFTFNYKTRTNAILATCKLPIYAKLFKPAAIKTPTLTVYKEINYLNYFINFVKHPFTGTLFGAFLVANALLFSKGLLLSSAQLIGMSAVYAATHLFSYFSSVKIKTLTAKVDKIISAIKKDELDISFEALYKLENQNRIFFSYWFPGNHALLFKYFFLEGILMSIYGDRPVGAKSCFERALKVATNEKDEFICIRRIINLIYEQYVECNKDKCHAYQENIKKYIEQVPSNLEFHAQLTAKLEQGLQECYALIGEGKVSVANKKFATLEFDAFTDELYPHLSIMYYQMEAALTLAGKPFEGDQSPITRDEESLTIARHSLLKAQWYVDTYYPEESVAHRRYVLGLENFWARLPVIPYLENPGYMAVYDRRRVKTIVEPIEKEVPNKHVKIELEPLKLSM